ncbi:bifunctional non-homologous end joining protein LigD [Paraburkholderia fungorum]|jgi:bifunctional non-homologous end joining protein LigD|uniref:DNA ligase D n=1 Tax=Paraburkholderia fungorum TaxID=134537 RepID=UPI000D0796E2|nr:DNA ligase D [Paraburkholderia fungorum]PRZ56374.1 bifunctional non-homologous end joining protein LigD [Paraburkholderia fungorum]
MPARRPARSQQLRALIAKGAVAGPLPEKITPQLATLATRAPEDGVDGSESPAWSFEIKFDGYRMAARIENGATRLLTRNLHDWTRKLPALAQEAAAVPVETAWIDGEIVVLNEAGLPDFNALQNAFDARRPAATAQVKFFAFDLLHLNGLDLRPLPLALRREALESLLSRLDSDRILFSQAFSHRAEDVLRSACELNLEGVIAKRLDAPHRSGRSTDWLKLKCKQRQEFVVGGFTTLEGVERGVRALVLGVHERDGKLHYAGKVATSLKAAPLRRLEEELQANRAKKSPFAEAPEPENNRTIHWLKPTLVAEVSFLEWTPSGGIRHAQFLSLRADKPASEITREEPVDAPHTDSRQARPGRKSRASSIEAASASSIATATATASKRSSVVAGVPISNASRVLDPQSKTTKLDVARYWDAVAEAALPYLASRPVSLVRAPDGLAGELFFQKHAERMTFGAIRRLPRDLHPNHEPLLVIDSREALVGAAQMGVVELHTWNAIEPDLEHPDRMVFDLDPDPTLPWSRMTEAANLVKLVLDELGLRSWLKTSGGKGLHVVVPLDASQSWTEVKGFSHAVAKHMARVVPTRFAAVLGPKNRVKKIFIDYLRNGKAQSTIVAFSPRARPGMGVSMPIDWSELPDVQSGDHWSMPSSIERVRTLGEDPWREYWETRQRITARMRKMLQP